MVKWDCFVGNIEHHVRDEQLRMIFSEVGFVRDIRMKKENGPFCYGFVEFDHPDSVRAAIALLDGRVVGSRQITVNHSNNSGLMGEQITKVPEAQSNAIGLAIDQNISVEDMAKVMRETQEFAKAQPREMQTMLKDYPNLAVALLHVAFRLNMSLPQAQQTQAVPFAQPPSWSAAAPVVSWGVFLRFC